MKLSPQQIQDIRITAFSASNGTDLASLNENLHQLSDQDFSSISEKVYGSISKFISELLSGQLGNGVLARNYLYSLIEYGSTLEEVFAVFSNNLELDKNGDVINYEFASYRAAQRINVWHIGSSYKVEPDFSEEELELH